MSDFVGVWQRTAIYEPRGVLGPDSDQKKTVIWVQSKSGTFIDIRFDPGAEYDPLLLKSFGGTTSFDSESCYLTWKREVDYRIMVRGVVMVHARIICYYTNLGNPGCWAYKIYKF